MKDKERGARLLWQLKAKNSALQRDYRANRRRYPLNQSREKRRATGRTKSQTRLYDDNDEREYNREVGNHRRKYGEVRQAVGSVSPD